MKTWKETDFLKDLKKGYNRKVKNSKLGSALRETTGMLVSDAYDRGAKELGKNKYGKPLSQYMKDKRGSNVKKITGMTGVGLRVGTTVDGRMRKNPSWDYDGRMRPAVVRHDLSKLNLKHGKGLRMSGSGACEMCGGSMNDKFLFADQAL